MNIEDRKIKSRKMWIDAGSGVGKVYSNMLKKYKEDPWDLLEKKYPKQFKIESDLMNNANDICIKYNKGDRELDSFRDALKDWYLFWMEYLKSEYPKSLG